MCGVAGQMVVSGEENRLVADVRAMADVLAHRGPDASTWWSDGERGVALSHRRLAIIDLSPTGAQPMTSGTDRWVISYNGEIYNHRQLRVDLEHKGVQFRGSSDTETLLAGFDAWGIDETLRRADGMFAFGAWDRRDARLTIGRDRLGEKPMYWTADRTRFAFASELRGLTALGDVTAQIDESAVASVLAYGFVRSPSTILRHCRQLQPGHLLEARVCDGEVRTVERQWWSLTDLVASSHAAQRHRSLDVAIDELDELLASAVSARLQSDVPLGAFLSGGLDSSLVAAMAQRALGSTPLPTFTVRVPGDRDESTTAASIARHLGTDHTVVDLGDIDVLAAVQRASRVWDEPFADPSMIPTLLVCEAARQSLTVCLGGDGGDELFAGYNRYALGNSIERATRWMPAPARRAAGRLLSATPPAAAERVNRLVARVLPERWRLVDIGDKLRKAGAMLSSSLPSSATNAWSALAGVWPVAASTSPLPPALAGLGPVEQMMFLDTSVVLPDNMLVKVDRASMAASLEVRVPFLAPDLLAWAWRQPLEAKTARGVGKVVVRGLGERLLPAGVAGKAKLGFDPPLAAWLRGPLRGWADDLLEDSMCVERGLLDRATLDATWREHGDGRRNWDYRLWSVLMVENWVREHSASW